MDGNFKVPVRNCQGKGWGFSQVINPPNSTLPHPLFVSSSPNLCSRDKSSNGTWVNGNKVTNICLYYIIPIVFFPYKLFALLLQRKYLFTLLFPLSYSLQVIPCFASLQICIRIVQVGKDKMWPLEHNSEISFAGANKKVSLLLS